MNKDAIRRNFSNAVTYYDKHAGVQKQAAERLSKALEPWKYSIAEGPILEIGAGTGFFTRHLLQMFEKKEFIISDLSENMVDYCRDMLGEPDSVKFLTLDAEKENWKDSSYALIAGNFVLQWFQTPAVSLSNMTKALKPGGILLMSFPGNGSFQNWRKCCLELGFPFTANALPDVEQVIIELSMGPVKVDFYEDNMFESYASVLDFFRHLKQAGLSTNLTGKKLTVKQLRLLNDYWLKQNGEPIKVQYHTAFIAAKRDLET